MRNRLIAAIAALVMGFSGPVIAKVSPAEAGRLKNDLTPVGAERAGNEAGTIPAWTGGLATPPANWREGTIETNPFPIPQNGLEAIWNHILRYRGEALSFRSASATPQRDGSFNAVVNNYDYFFAYSHPGAELEDIDNKIFYLKT